VGRRAPASGSLLNAAQEPIRGTSVARRNAKVYCRRNRQRCACMEHYKHLARGGTAPHGDTSPVDGGLHEGWYRDGWGTTSRASLSRGSNQLSELNAALRNEDRNSQSTTPSHGLYESAAAAPGSWRIVEEPLSPGFFPDSSSPSRSPQRMSRQLLSDFSSSEVSPPRGEQGMTKRPLARHGETPTTGFRSGGSTPSHLFTQRNSSNTSSDRERMSPKRYIRLLFFFHHQRN
jgi:hypothetical protein